MLTDEVARNVSVDAQIDRLATESGREIAIRGLDAVQIEFYYLLKQQRAV